MSNASASLFFYITIHDPRTTAPSGASFAIFPVFCYNREYEREEAFDEVYLIYPCIFLPAHRRRRLVLL